MGGFSKFPKLLLSLLPTLNNSATKILVRNDDTGEVEYIDKSTINGTVTEVTGVSGEITVDAGTTTPLIGIDPAYTASKQDTLTEENLGEFMDLELATKLTPGLTDTLLARDILTGNAVEVTVGSVVGLANAYADSKVQDSISDGTIDKAPSQNAVFDALALKANANSVVYSKLMSINSSITGTTSEVFVGSILIPANTMSVGHRMEIKMALSKLGAVSNNFNPAIYISPTGGGISGEKIMTGRIATTAKFSVNSRNLEIKSGSIRALNFTTPIVTDEAELPTANFQTTATPINYTIDNYLNIVSACNLSTETSVIEYVSVNIFR